MALRISKKWTIDDLLKSLVAAGCGYKRADDGCDLLACRLVGTIDRHYVYVNLYSSRAMISYDLEDEGARDKDLDHAVERGRVAGIKELARLCDAWLNGKGKVSEVKRRIGSIVLNKNRKKGRG